MTKHLSNLTSESRKEFHTNIERELNIFNLIYKSRMLHLINCLFIFFIFYCSEATSQAFPYCTEPGLNFSTTNAAYSEDDGDFAGGRRGKTSRVSLL